MQDDQATSGPGVARTVAGSVTAWAGRAYTWLFNFKLFVVVSLGSGGISEPVSWIIENLSFFVATLADLA